jgi:hypothetical protein
MRGVIDNLQCSELELSSLADLRCWRVADRTPQVLGARDFALRVTGSAIRDERYTLERQRCAVDCRAGGSHFERKPQCVFDDARERPDTYVECVYAGCAEVCGLLAREIYEGYCNRELMHVSEVLVQIANRSLALGIDVARGS